MAKRPTVADLMANRGRHQYAMLRVETLDEAAAAAAAGVELFSIPPAMIHDRRFREVAPMPLPSQATISMKSAGQMIFCAGRCRFIRRGRMGSIVQDR